MLNVIEVTQDILNGNPNPNDPCGCAIHEAIMLKLDQIGVTVDDEDKVSVGYDNIWINSKMYKCSPELAEWQREFCENYITSSSPSARFENDDWSECYAEPITIVLKGNTLALLGEVL